MRRAGLYRFAHDRRTERRAKDRDSWSHPAGDLGRGSDIAAGCVYLASAEAGYVTGQTLHINGGMAMI
ncbi:MAG: SDR family oxidoreductase [Asticcacaulis sp.]